MNVIVRRFKLIGVCVLAAGAAIVSLTFSSQPPGISLIHRETIILEKVSGPSLERDDYEPIIAVLELTNATSRPITYATFMTRPVFYKLCYQTPSGWEQEKWFPHANLMGHRTLAPSQATTFEVTLDKKNVCKVALDYSDDRKPSRIWEILPYRLRERLPWCKTWRTIMTDPIDLRNEPGPPAQVNR